GHDRGYDFSELAQRVSDLGVRTYILQNGNRVAEAIRAAGGTPIMISDLDEIVHDVLANLPPNSICLLSPASPSFGQFKNFVERGEQFFAAIKSAA
ncbi:MAG: hypothetical protein AAB839_02990, partial [Patescibacteria group bacterium]